MSSSKEGKGNITKDNNAMIEMLREREADSNEAEGSWITVTKKKKKKPARENWDRHREPGCTQWTRASRNDKTGNRIKRSKPIRGGDSIASESGATMTLSVAFQGTGIFEGKTYGLTCNHLINEGDSDEIFLMTTSSNSNAESNQHTSKTLIGNVVSRDEETDSMIFEFHRGVKVDTNTIKTGPGPDDVHEIDVHKHLTSYPSAGMALVAFGFQRRGTYGRVVRDERPPNLPSSAIGIEPNDLGSQPGSELISHDGDCGMIYVDENGNPIAMHVGFTAKKMNGGDTLYRSWAIDLYDIMGHHKREYFEGVHNYPSTGRAIIRGFPVQGHVPIFDELPIETQLKILLELADGEAERAKLLARLAVEESKRATDGVSTSNNSSSSKRLPIETHLKIQLELADGEAERARLLARLAVEESKRANDDS